MQKIKSSVDLCKLLKIQNFLSECNLGFFNFSDLIPFDVKRLYYLNNIKKDVKRVQHAHINLEQFIIVLNGSIKIQLDDGRNTKEFFLKPDNNGLYVPPGLWRDIISMEDSTCFIVLASLEFDENDYIRSYIDFEQYTKEN